MLLLLPLLLVLVHRQVCDWVVVLMLLVLVLVLACWCLVSLYLF